MASKGDAVSTNDLVYAVRKANVDKLVLDKFRGNKSAFARATMVHPNHINLLLSNNPAHHRNLGETLARKIEQQLGLPSRWLDNAHDSVTTVAPISIDATPVHESLLGAVRTCDTVSAISMTNSQIQALDRRITAPENVLVASVDTADMEPALENGEAVLIDTAVKAVTVDGIYVVVKHGQPAMLRKFTRNAVGASVISYDNNPPEPVSAAAMKSLSVVARVVCAIRMHRV